VGQIGSSNNQGIEGETVTAEEFNQYIRKFRHVVEAAAIITTLDNVGRDISKVFAKIDGFFSKDANGEDVCSFTLNTSCDRFLEQCTIVDEFLCQHLHEERQTVNAQRIRVRYRIKPSSNQHQSRRRRRQSLESGL
jgi:hypothetical protein